MRLAVLFFALFIAPTVNAKEHKLTGKKARAVLEGLVAAGFTYNDSTLAPVVPAGEIWVMTTSGFTCSYYKGMYYDDLTAGVSCSQGGIPFPGAGTMSDMRNPMWVAKTFEPYAYDQSTDGQYQISVNSAKCIYTIASNKYACTITNSKP